MRFFYKILFCVFFLFSCTNQKNEAEGLQKKSEVQAEHKIFYLSLSSSPETLHPIRASTNQATKIHQLTLDTLLGRNLDTYELEPRLAEKWEISPDHMVFTFYLRKNVRWHDGHPFTAQDVKFSLEAFQDVSYGGAHRMSYFENIDRVEIINPHTIRVYAKKRAFGVFENFAAGSSLSIIPQHIYKGNKKKLSRTLIGTGPYILTQYDRNKKIVLKKNNHWWGNGLQPKKYHFDQIVYRIIQSTHDELIRIAGGQLDFLGLSSESYFKKTLKAPWGVTVFKKKVQNLSPKGYSFAAWNLKRPLFKDKRVRLALSHLMNRSLMNKKFSNSSNWLTAGPTYRQSDYVDPSVSPVLFRPKKAMQLLQAAGWRDSNQNGILDKMIDGKQKEFRFTMLIPIKDIEKYMVIFQQDLKKYGIEMDIKFLEWTSFIKLMDEGGFDALTLAWVGGEVEWFPKQIWHSASIANQGSNFIGYSNKEVDRLIDLADEELDREKRVQILKQVYKMIAEDHPYSFMFNPKYSFYAHSNRMVIEKPTYNYGVGYRTFWKIH